MNLIKRTLAIREGGQTIRCHTMPYMGPYNVAIHSYNALSLLIFLYPGRPSLNLIKAVLWHDVPERWTGDVPSPAKWASRELKDALDKLEHRILKALGIDEFFNDLSVWEKEWLRYIDLLELWTWAKEQVGMGSPIPHDVSNKVDEIFTEEWHLMPDEIKNYISEFNWSRTPECRELIDEKQS